MKNVGRIKGRKANLSVAAKELGVSKESLTKDNNLLLQDWIAKKGTATPSKK